MLAPADGSGETVVKSTAGLAAVLALCVASSGAMAASSDCVGAATGTSAVTGTPAFLYLQCYKPIQIPGNPLQTFGGSGLIRTNATTASYYLADRSNLGVDVVNAQPSNSPRP